MAINPSVLFEIQEISDGRKQILMRFQVYMNPNQKEE